MRKFINKLIVFALVGLVIGELVSRLFVLTSDIPRREIDEFGIQKYIPNQNGKWKGGEHGWKINNRGWVGELPVSFDNLITIIGDSYIENFMNPESCHQNILLKQKLSEYNFFEGARSGVSFIEALEIAKHFEKLDPSYQLIYMGEGDLFESISILGKQSDITQVDLINNKIIPGQIKSPGLKTILYNWKFAYYLYNRFPFKLTFGTKDKPKSENKANALSESDLHSLYGELLGYCSANYYISNVILIFRPETSDQIVSLAHQFGFKTLHLNSTGDKNWSFEHDSHWTCHGHQQVAKQVATKIQLLN